MSVKTNRIPRELWKRDQCVGWRYAPRNDGVPSIEAHLEAGAEGLK